MGEALELMLAAAHLPGRPRRTLQEGVVRVRCEGRRGLHTGFLRDLSAGGMFVRILDPELAGRHLDFDLDVELGGQRRRISGRGEVLWCRASYEGPSRPPGMGVRFLHLEEGSRAILHKLLGGEEGAPLIDPLVPPAEAWRSNHPGDPGRHPGPAGAASSHRLWRRWVPALAALALAGGLALVVRPEQPSRTEPFSGEVLVGTSSGLSVEERATRSAPAEARAPTSPPAPTELPSPAARAEAGPERSGTLPPAEQDLPAASESSPPPAPMSRLTSIRWEPGAQGTVLTLVGDGPIEASRIRSSGIGGEHPRLILRLLGVTDEPRRHEVGSPELLRIRTGYHETGGGQLHVVLDLARPGVVASSPELLERGLRITLRSPWVSGLDEVRATGE